MRGMHHRAEQHMSSWLGQACLREGKGVTVVITIRSAEVGGYQNCIDHSAESFTKHINSLVPCALRCHMVVKEVARLCGVTGKILGTPLPSYGNNKNHISITACWIVSKKTQAASLAVTSHYLTLILLATTRACGAGATDRVQVCSFNVRITSLHYPANISQLLPAFLFSCVKEQTSDCERVARDSGDANRVAAPPVLRVARPLGHEASTKAASGRGSAELEVMTGYDGGY